VTAEGTRGVRTGAVAADGSPVAVYLALPASPEFDPVIHEATATPGLTVLDLGCGTGRLSNLLASLGCTVVGVDESAAMLAHLDDPAEAVHARIEELELDRVFDVVVLASNLVNTVDLDRRQATLATVRRHLHHGGKTLIQRYDPAWASTVTSHDGRAGDVKIRLDVTARDVRQFEARVTYALEGHLWTQRFRARVVDDGDMTAALAEADLRLARWLDSRWAVATPGVAADVAAPS
jgi:2-polyprenyl-3-methyl-5-hydroxy-6-metoxy-1,4-benzoquinol methylase